MQSQECYYDLKYDWDLIVSSFLEQYGIRLYEEYDTISHLEFNQLLRGINSETALGKVVRIRAEKDNNRIKEMTKYELQLRKEWQDFRKKQEKEKNKANIIVLKKEDISKVFSDIFK